MLKLTAHQHAMLQEMDIEVPDISTPAPSPATQSPATQPPVKRPLTSEPKRNATPQSALPQHEITAAALPRQSPHNRTPASEAIATQAPIQPGQTPAATSAVMSERTQLISQMSWEEMQQAASQCTACQLCQSRTQSVFGVGGHDARWMIVGEAPGEQEDRQGEPFVGQAGKLLDKMLEQLNIARRPQKNETPIYIANVLKCRPPRNRNPDPQEMLACEPFLKRQIELLAPKVILAMGRFAVQTLLQSHDAIGKLRGKVHFYQNIPVVVTYHPAYLLRNPVDKRKSWADLCLAADLFEKPSDTVL